MVLKILKNAAHRRWRSCKYFHHAGLGACLSTHSPPSGFPSESVRRVRLWSSSPKASDSAYISPLMAYGESRTSQLKYQVYWRSKNWVVWKLSFLLLSSPHQISCITPSGQALYLHMLHTVLVWTSTELFSTRCPTQKSPLHQHLFTSGLKLLQGGESQMGSVKGQQSHLLHTDANLFTSVPTFVHACADFGTELL